MERHDDVRREPRYGSIPVIRRMRPRSNLYIHNRTDMGSLSSFQNAILPTDQHSDTEKEDSESFCTEYSGVDLNTSHINKSKHTSQKPVFEHTVESLQFVRDTNARGRSISHTPSERLFNQLLWPTFAICIPMLGLSAALIAIILSYTVKAVPSIFVTTQGTEAVSDRNYLLVNFPATKLVFLASFLSTAAPILIGCIMSMVAVLIYKELIQTSKTASFTTLPTPYQMSLLIGVLSASYEQLYSAFMHLWSRKRRARTAPVLTYAMLMFLFSILLGVAVALTDAYLHISTRTVSVVLHSKPLTPKAQLGRGLNSYCLGIDRVKANGGFPCSYSLSSKIVSSPDFQDGQFEARRLAHNSSMKAQIQLAHVNASEVNTIAFVTPLPADLPAQTNYRASSIGVGASCKFIPPSSCNITSTGNQKAYTSFNCSSQFWGTLGLQGVAAPILGVRPYSPNVSFLAVNPTSSLIYNYFTDAKLETVYNTLDLNGTAQRTESSTPWTDDQLKNTIYAAYAWRSGISNFPGWTKNGMYLSDLVHPVNGTSFVDYFVKCTISAYDVQHTWTNNSLQAITITKYENGSVLNIWAGTIPYMPGMGDGGAQLQEYTTQSIISSNDTANYELSFGNQLSISALSVIAAYTSERTVLEEQAYSIVLLAKVPKLALGLLLACSLIYPIVGIILVIYASRAIKKTGWVDPLFSFWGLTWAAFVDSAPRDDDMPAAIKSRHLRDSEEDYRMYIQQGGDEGDHFGLLKRGPMGEVTEMERSWTVMTPMI